MAGQPSSSANSFLVGTSASQQSCQTKQILDEWEDKFLVARSGVDPLTGLEFEPSWENKSDVSLDLRQAWELSRSQRTPSCSQAQVDIDDESQLAHSPKTRRASLTATQPQSSSLERLEEAAATNAGRQRRSSGAPSPSTFESLVPDSQAEQEEQQFDLGTQAPEVEMANEEEEEDEDEEPSTQSITMELPPSQLRAAAACEAQNQQQQQQRQPLPPQLTATNAPATTHPSPTQLHSPFFAPPTTSRPTVGPFNREFVARAIAAAMLTPALVKQTLYRPLSPPCEEELSSQRSSQRSSQGSGSIVATRCVPAPRVARPQVVMGLAGPQILPRAGNDSLDGIDSYAMMVDAEGGEAPLQSTPPNGAQGGAILVADTPSAPADSGRLPDSITSSTSSEGAAGVTVVGTTQNGGPSQPSRQPEQHSAPPPPPATVKRPAAEDDDEARKKIKPSEAPPAAAVPVVSVVAPVPIAPAPAPEAVAAAPSKPKQALPPTTIGLIRLVRESKFVTDADSTKAEIIKFVTDPKAYAASLGAPLLRTPAWAFELRRATYDGIEKHDWILINSTEGTYFLKRTPSTQQVAFAASLDHVPASRAPSRAGSAQPQTAEAAPAPVVKEPSPEPALPPASEMSREQLEAEFNKLLALAAELPALQAAAAELAAAKTQITTLTRQNKALQSSKDSSQSDFNYMQAQYAEASNAALARAREAQVAEAQVAELRGKLSVGMEQRDLVLKSMETRLSFDLKKTKGELTLLKAEKKRGELVNAVAMEKAALWDAHLAKEELIKENGVEEEESSSLPEQDTAEASRDGERPRLWDLSRDGPGPSQASETAPGSSQAVTGASLEFVFACEWKAAGSQPCEHVAQSKEQLSEHVARSHLPLE